MTPQDREQLIDQLQAARTQISDLLRSVAAAQDWQPDADNWSFRYVAAHMVACDKECYQPRIAQIAAGQNPHFDLYLNTGRNFSGLDLQDSLDTWATTRQEMVEFFRSLSDDQLLLTGQHDDYGRITVPDYLRIGLGHDREHLRDLQAMLDQYWCERPA